MRCSAAKPSKARPHPGRVPVSGSELTGWRDCRKVLPEEHRFHRRMTGRPARPCESLDAERATAFAVTRSGAARVTCRRVLEDRRPRAPVGGRIGVRGENGVRSVSRAFFSERNLFAKAGRATLEPRDREGTPQSTDRVLKSSRKHCPVTSVCRKVNGLGEPPASTALDLPTDGLVRGPTRICASLDSHLAHALLGLGTSRPASRRGSIANLKGGSSGGDRCVESPDSAMADGARG